MQLDFRSNTISKRLQQGYETEMFSEKDCRKCWTCPSDRELKLRAKLNCGWSIHTGNLFRKIENIPLSELQIIEDVIRRASQIEKLEVERVGRMICKLENMTRNTLGDGKKTCSMCGIAFGFFSSFVHCVDCKKAVCEKCRVDTLAVPLDAHTLCKICSEDREVWKKSGGWFYGKFPTMTEDCQKECIAQISGSPSQIRAYDTWAHRAPDIVRFESFEPPEENHNDNSLYKDWTMNSTPDFHSFDEDDDSEYMELELFRKRFHELNKVDTNYLMVQTTKFSASCPSLTDFQESPKLTRKACIRKKKSVTGKIIRKISKAIEYP